MSELKPFKLNVSEETLNYIKKRVSSYPWHEMPNDGGWDYGTNIDYLKKGRNNSYRSCNKNIINFKSNKK